MTDPKRFAPRCGHPGCGEYASRGFGGVARDGSDARWYCPAHVPSDEARSVLAPPLPDAGGQGRLF
ncbi:MAG: hypothetical protein AB7R90_19390 [Reyranellaceae bacterium]